MHVQSSCFAHKTNCFLSLLLLLLSSSLLKVPIKNVKEISSASVEEHNKQTPRLRQYFGQISKNHTPLFPP